MTSVWPWLLTLISKLCFCVISARSSLLFDIGIPNLARWCFTMRQHVCTFMTRVRPWPLTNIHGWLGVLLMSFTHSFYLVFFFSKKKFSLPGILQANEGNSYDEWGRLYMWLWSTLKRPYWSYCENALFCPTLEKGAYYFAPVSLSMDQVMSSHIFWPLAWMFPNLIQWKPLRSTWPPLIFRSLRQR